jgi:hypothetical protein
MTPPQVRPGTAAAAQTIESIAALLADFLAEYPNALVLEDGKILFDMRAAKYALSTEHGRCALHLWSDDRNLVRTVTGAVTRASVLRLATQRFGQIKPSTLEISAERDRRTPTTRYATRTRYLRLIECVLPRAFPESTPDGLRTAMDLEKSFGPAYVRGSLLHGQNAWAVIAVNAEESPAIIDGILTLGVLWLAACREQAGGRRLYQGLRLILPSGMATLTLSRLAWMNPAAAQWELYELDERTEELTQRDAADHGNLTTRLVHLPDGIAARERFAEAAARIMALLPESMRPIVEQRLRSGTELAFLLHGLEFARIRTRFSGQSFNRLQEISFGTGPHETELTEGNAADLRQLVARLFERRADSGDRRDILFRMQPERWLESVLGRDLSLLDPRLSSAHVYPQVPAIAAADRGMLDLLGVSTDGRLAVIELKADEDLHLALQGLDYWIRVRWHHQQNPDRETGLGEFQRHGYFAGIPLAPGPPRLFLAAPALRIHPATEVVLRHLSPRVEWELIALDERWRRQIKVVWRKRSADLKP